MAHAAAAVSAKARYDRGAWPSKLVKRASSGAVAIAHVQLARVAADFVTAYPHVTLEVIAEDRKVDPVEDNYDLVIRIDPDHNERLVGRRILEDERLLVTSPDIAIPSRPGRRTPPFP